MATRSSLPAFYRREQPSSGLVAMSHSLRARHSLLSVDFTHCASPKDKVEYVLSSYEIHLFMSALIALSIAFEIVHTNERAHGEAGSLWQRVVYRVMLILFACELLFRFFVERLRFFCCLLNLAECVITGTDIVLDVLSWSDNNSVSFSYFRFIRLVRLTRVLRMLSGFRELFMMIHALQSALKAIFWATLLICCFLVVFSILGVEYIRDLVHDCNKRGLFDSDFERSDAFDSVWRACLTLLSTIAGDSWGDYAVPVMNEYPLSAFFFVGSFMAINLGALNLIVAVMVDRAADARREDKEYILQEKTKSFQLASERLNRLCQEIDTDGDGLISWEEFEVGALRAPELANLFKMMDITIEDLASIYNFLDLDGSGSVSYKEFVHQIHRLQTVDHRTMLVLLWQQNVLMCQKMDLRMRRTLSSILSTSGSRTTNEAGAIGPTRSRNSESELRDTFMDKIHEKPSGRSRNVFSNRFSGNADSAHRDACRDKPPEKTWGRSGNAISNRAAGDSHETLDYESNHVSCSSKHSSFSQPTRSLNWYSFEHLHPTCQGHNDVRMALEDLQQTVDSQISALIAISCSNIEQTLQGDYSTRIWEEQPSDVGNATSVSACHGLHQTRLDELKTVVTKGRHKGQIIPTSQRVVQAFETTPPHADLMRNYTAKFSL